VGINRWRRRVDDVVRRLVSALQPEDVVLGGGNARQIIELPPRCRIGANSNAFPGGFRLWGQKGPVIPASPVKPATAKPGKKAPKGDTAKPAPRKRKATSAKKKS